ncbi:GNAT family N-acetyltransferase [Micromonospora krabiensis]|uniref:Acetyltransferase (GNAT) family protein n=1 Tax=Micromonospora krabiensis TaxID=307121 RepID=A0A1C3N767_9ACTN|nr:GNAT family N-acetyltransferase [Micromonospora krabiensis]SBV28442.1 Acetyltransferase (GNAT) family protein [Micromonospora krabiensis]
MVLVKEPAEPLDVGGVLRALRRGADLSQRELADRAGVPQATVARIESGRARYPKLATVERLVRAAGGSLVIGVPDAPTADAEPTPSPIPPLSPVTPVPHDDLRDDAGRRYPAHLDVWEVREPRAHERNTYLAYEQGSETERETVLDGILVTFQYRRLGIGRRLVEALLDGMRADGIRTAYAIADDGGTDLPLACGFDLEPGRAWALRLVRRR